MNLPYDILNLLITNGTPRAMPDPLTLVLTLVLGIGTALMAAAFVLVEMLAGLRTFWARWKIIFYPLAASAALGGAVLLWSAYDPRYVGYLLMGPAIGIVFCSVRDRYNPRIPKPYLWSYLVGAPMAVFMLFIYAVGRSAEQSPFIGHRASLALGIVFFDFFLCGVIGIIAYLLRRTPKAPDVFQTRS